MFVIVIFTVVQQRLGILGECYRHTWLVASDVERIVIV